MSQPKTPPRPKHLYSRLDTDLQQLKDRVVQMGRLVDEQVQQAVGAFVTRDGALAALVVTGDKQVNQLERELDEACVLALALLQPAASDLRFVAATLKIVTDLERIGDFAVNIAKSVAGLSPRRSPTERELPALSESAVRVLRDALDAFVQRDTVRAELASTADLPLTARLVRLGEELKQEIRRDPAVLDDALATLFVTKHLERIAEHATNIAEMVLYTERGEDIRHLVERPG